MALFPLRDDIELVRELLGLDMRALSADMGLSRMTLSRWMKEPEQASPDKLEAFYGYAYRSGVLLNEIHAQLFQEETSARGLVPLFHGSKRGIEGTLALSKSREDNDFGRGFYCGESYQQAATFVGGFQSSICYYVAFDAEPLVRCKFHVDDRWMLAVSFFRNRLGEFAKHSYVRAIVDEVLQADFIVAPIADNRMFDIMDSFSDGVITDVQCRHSLSATNLGSQFVLRSEASLAGVVKLQAHYLCADEKRELLDGQRERAKFGSDKVKAAMRKYRGEGRYIEELLS